MTCKEKKILPVWSEHRELWFTGSVSKDSGNWEEQPLSTLHRPHGSLAGEEKSPGLVTGQFWIVIQLSLQLPEKPTWELWYLLRHDERMTVAGYKTVLRTVFDPCAEQHHTGYLSPLPTALLVKRGAKVYGSINIARLPGPQLTASGVKLKNWYFRDMHLPHFKDMTSIENKTVKTKQFCVAGKHCDKYEDFQSCQTVLKMSTLPSFFRYLTFPNTVIE